MAQGAFLDFAEEERIFIDGEYKKDNEAEKGFKVSECEKNCLSQGILNAYHAYEAGVFQVNVI